MAAGVETPYKDIFFAYVPLGWITFGGPQAHLSLLYHYFVIKKKWISEQMYAELLGLGQGLPGPTSTQIAFAVAMCRGGLGGGLFGFLWWSFPGLVIMTLAGLGVNRWLSDESVPAWLVALQDGAASAAVGLVATAAVKLCEGQIKDKLTTVIAFVAMAITVVLHSHNLPWLFPTVMAVSGAITVGRFYYRRRKHPESRAPLEGDSLPSTPDEDEVAMGGEADVRVSMHSLRGHGGASATGNGTHQAVGADSVANNDDEDDEDGDDIIFEDDQAALMLKQNGSRNALSTKKHNHHHTEDGETHRIRINYSIGVGVLFLVSFVVLLVLCIGLRRVVDSKALNVFEAFFRVGSIIFGGGQVVLPMLLDEVVKTGWVTERQFLFGFSFVSALPGPMFNFSAYLGAIAMGVGGALLAWIGLFLPGLILIAGVMPLWHRFRTLDSVQAVFVGVNACACGLIVAAVYLLWNKAVKDDAFNAVLAMAAYLAVGKFDAPAAAAVLGGGLVSVVRHYV